VTPNIFYLHGFASSPQSSKARFLEARLAERGIALRVPDLNAPDFEMLTITRMIRQVEAEILSLAAAPTVLVGSSLGGLVAVELGGRWASRRSRRRGPESGHAIDRLVLLAPALEFARLHERELGGEAMRRWRETGVLPVHHYAEGRTRNVRYALFEDALRYDPFAAFLDFPILIFQGRRDESVDPASVEAFARSRPNVSLRMLDDDHQMLSSLDTIWREMALFLGLEGPR
jgi:predicted esterase YcpF (UPF0227 family)